jgi:hypothetical protein
MTTISSYEASRMAFYEVFVNRNHLDVQVRNATHNTRLSDSADGKETAWRLATDLQFLSILENRARLRGDMYFADFVLVYINVALNLLDEQLKEETFFTNMFSPFTAQNLIALTFVKKLNSGALAQNSQYNKALSTVETYLPVFLNSAVQSYSAGIATWDTTLFGPGSGTLTYEQLAKEQRHIISSNGIKRFAGSLNTYSIMGGALGLYGALLTDVAPISYEHRNKIVTLGNLAIAMSESGSATIGHLNNIGGGRSEGGEVSTGYASWVARGLAQIATGTTFDLYTPTSKYMKEANLIKQGLLTVLSRKGYMPDKFTDFSGNHANTDGNNLKSDKTIYLYELAWCGDQEAINVIEKHLADKHGLGRCKPIIIDSLLSDEDEANGSNAHRALAGLTAGMIKSLYVNYSDSF